MFQAVSSTKYYINFRDIVGKQLIYACGYDQYACACDGWCQIHNIERNFLLQNMNVLKSTAFKSAMKQIRIWVLVIINTKWFDFYESFCNQSSTVPSNIDLCKNLHVSVQMAKKKKKKMKFTHCHKEQGKRVEKNIFLKHTVRKFFSYTMCVCVCVFVFVCLRACIHVCVCMHMCARVYMRAYL